ncbi:MAG: cell envelope integrity protein TolA [Deltaproteobacteria bacterium]|nr:cell envelope integrity protein TolA [Deltaproteobacteria bacterium]
MSTYRSVLVPERQSLASYVVAAVALHLILVIVGVTASDWVKAHRRPIVDPATAMTVELKVLPKSKTRMPERASHTPKPQGQVAPKPSPTAEKPIPRTSELAVHKPDAPPQAPGTPDRTDERQALMRNLLMHQLVQDTPEGTVDREESDPNSTATEGVNTGSSGDRADPALARYVSQVKGLFMAQFHPLPTLVMAHPELRVTVQVDFDLDTGEVLGSHVETSSGNGSFDGAATRAVAAVRQIPVPPENFRASFRDGLSMEFRPQ